MKIAKLPYFSLHFSQLNYSPVLEIVTPMILEAEKNMQILTSSQLRQKIKRMAVEIYELNFDALELSVVGIEYGGYALSTLICDELKEISSIKLTHARLSLDKNADKQPQITLDVPIEEFANKPLLVIDDVLNTGKTLWFALCAFSDIPLPKIEVAVMVARNHSLYPIKSDIVGYGISTTLSNHVKVILDNEQEMGAYLV